MKEVVEICRMLKNFAEESVIILGVLFALTVVVSICRLMPRESYCVKTRIDSFEPYVSTRWFCPLEESK